MLEVCWCRSCSGERLWTLSCGHQKACGSVKAEVPGAQQWLRDVHFTVVMGVGMGGGERNGGEHTLVTGTETNI